MTYLLDVNVLIALIDQSHVAHDDAHRWFEGTGQADGAICPVTENGVIRIIGNPRYPNSPGSPAVAAGIVKKMRNLPGHRFWSGGLSLAGRDDIDVPALFAHNLRWACEILENVSTLNAKKRAKLARDEYGFEVLKNLHLDLIDSGLMSEFAQANAYTIEGKPFDINLALKAAGIQ